MDTDVGERLSLELTVQHGIKSCLVSEATERPLGSGLRVTV